MRTEYPSHEPLVQEEIASVEALARKAHEAIGRVVTAVYNAVLANLSKLAARDAKHGAHFVLENLSALQPRIVLLAGKVPDIRACRDDLQVRPRASAEHLGTFR